ncbi:MAG TPA: squalene/phytoene synthase family protein [Planctomycetaceae bacterium]|nr:squalene/phytoene synthase family protein [Planctomycetaceae bacterium]
MTHERLTIDDSYRLCHAMARRAGSSFYPCFLVLHEPQRRAMEALYAFMRHTDDLGDRPASIAENQTVSPLDQLHAWRAALNRALGSTPGGMDGSPILAGAERILPAVADTVRRFDIPAKYLHAVIDGVEMDLTDQTYETFGQLAEYCHRVASAVGLSCVHIWGFRGDEPRESARSCGLAFQLTNILRDLGEDSRMGRIYLPREDIAQCGYSVEALQRGETGEAFARLMKLEIGRARQFYREGADLFDRLEPAGLRIFGMMIDVYHRLLGHIERNPGAVFRQRVRLGRIEKMQVAARWLLLPPRREALP